MVKSQRCRSAEACFLPTGNSEEPKVFQEILRPVFSLLEAGPLSECCSFISYDGILELSRNPHLGHLTDSVLGEYEQFVT